MDKISELKNKLCWNPKITMDEQHAFIEGFDAAMDLELQIKFAEWKDYETRPYYLDTDKIAYYFIVGVNGEYSLKELFDYWLENIYKSE